MTRYAEGTTVQPEKPRERPILFSGPMVKAILAGTKTQTRRVVKFPKLSNTTRIADARPGKSLFARQSVLEVPYGDPSDDPFERVYPPFELGGQLWVRETWQPIWATDARPPHGESSSEGWAIGYPATDGVQEWHDEDKGVVPTCKPSIFMRRWMSRITLEVTEVRVERLQAISEADAKAEGVETRRDLAHLAYEIVPARTAFEELWDSINGKREGCAWSANPWVWVVSFKRIEAVR